MIRQALRYLRRAFNPLKRDSVWRDLNRLERLAKLKHQRSSGYAREKSARLHEILRG